MAGNVIFFPESQVALTSKYMQNHSRFARRQFDFQYARSCLEQLSPLFKWKAQNQEASGNPSFIIYDHDYYRYAIRSSEECSNFNTRPRVFFPEQTLFNSVQIIQNGSHLIKKPKNNATEGSLCPVMIIQFWIRFQVIFLLFLRKCFFIISLVIPQGYRKCSSVCMPKQKQAVLMRTKIYNIIYNIKFLGNILFRRQMFLHANG